ncbi:MAG: PP2C family protein-serine/threonine phosphatase, partial [Thermoanaerobaculia bacterium]
LTDAEMVRRRFDASNIRWLGFVSGMAFVAALIQCFIALERMGTVPWILPQALLHLAMALVAALFFGELAYFERRGGTRKPRVPIHLIARNLTPWVIAFFITEFTLLTFFRSGSGNTWMPWAMVVPWMIVPVRLDVSRRLALHISLLAVIAMNVLLFGVRNAHVPEFTAATLVSLFTFFLGAYTSRRLRKQTLDDWSDRREQAREQMRMREELRFAREVQLSMLPEAAPSTEWIDVAATSLPATEVGGDYYDFFVDEGTFTIVCGDVAGHGLGSGIVLASLRSGFTLLRDSLGDPAGVMQRLNDLVAQTSRRRMLATAAVLRFDRQTQRAIVASAGHPPLLVLTSRGVDSIELFAPPLGVRLPYRVPSRELTFSSGDLFVLHTDGLYEWQNEKGEIYGLDRLAGVIANLRGLDVTAARDAILADVDRFRGGTLQEDDVTLVVARVR